MRSTDGQRSSSSRNHPGKNRQKIATNPFIIFFMRVRSKKPRQPVTRIAKVAGKLWTKMTPEQRQKYVDIAQAERKRREEKKRKKKIPLNSLKKK